MASLLDKMMGFLGYAPAGEVGPGKGVPAVYAEPFALTSVTVQALRAMIDEHDRGMFVRSALLAELITRDADMFGALLQRQLALLSCQTEVEPADPEDPRAVEQADHLRREWPRIASRAAQSDMLNSAVLLGFALAQIVWEYDEDSKELCPRLDPWPSACVEYRSWERRWYALTLTGPVPITPGDGQWVLYAPRSVHKPHLWGALRCTGEWYLRSSYSAGDASKQSELHGIPVWLAELPAGAKETPDAKAFIKSIRSMGRGRVIPIPQGREKHESYNVRLEEASVDAFKIFDFLIRTSGGKMRLAILGQDLTSQNNLVGTNASSTTGKSVTEDVVEADAETWGECSTHQVSVPITRYRAGDGRLAPKVAIDAEPEADAKANADAMSAQAAAARAWRDLGVNVDLTELATRAGVPIATGPMPPTAPPAPGTL